MTYDPRSTAEPPAPTSEQAAHARAIQFVQSWVRNSPWLAIAVLLHVLLIAIMSVYYTTRESAPAEEVVTTVSVAQPRAELPEELVTPPEIIDRNSVPIQDPNEQEGPVNPDENYIPEADPGKVGEITD